MAATRNEIPFLAVPTAASMNGYTSAIAAILSNGVKRTLPTVQVTGIFADVDILAQAPVEMTLAGFGDLVSKPFSNACWYLSARMTGGTRSEAPSRLLDEPFRELLTHAKGIGEKEVEAVAALTETLLLSGCAMALAGSSSPASGGEHLLSHYWDMVAHANHRPLRGLHGTQVGIATLITGRLYEGMLHANEGYSSVSERMEVYPSSSEMMAEGVRKRHPDLPHGIREEIVAQALQKYLPPQEQLERLYTLERDWPEIREDLLGMLMPIQDIEDALRAAGAPVRAEEIGVDLKTLQDTVAVARDIRSRYTILDFASDMGVLESYCDMLAGAP
jgi:glycerol-1-phosphate dehydrogenase [NAD(P)+]